MKRDAPDIFAVLMGLLVPLGWIFVRWLAGTAAFPASLAGWVLLEAAIQGWLISLRHRERLSVARFRRFQFAAGLIVGMPATVLCTYLGAVPEFRLVPFFFLVLQRSGWAQAAYSLSLFVAGLLLFYPFFSGNTAFLALELYRPMMGLMVVSALVWLQRRRARQVRQRLRALRRGENGPSFR